MLIYVFSQEVFPTAVRSMGTGFSYSISTLLAFLSPFQISLAKSMNVYPTFVLGVSGLLFLVPSFFFEETLGKPMKEYIKEEVEEENEKEQIMSEKSKLAQY